jgi:hypothetical protein
LGSVQNINEHCVHLSVAGFEKYGADRDVFDELIPFDPHHEQSVIKPSMTRKQSEQIILKTLCSDPTQIICPFQFHPDDRNNQPIFSTWIRPTSSSIYPSNSSSLVHLKTMNESDPCGISAVLWLAKYVNCAIDWKYHVTLIWIRIPN